MNRPRIHCLFDFKKGFGKVGQFFENCLLLIQELTQVLDPLISRIETQSLYGFKKSFEKVGYFFERCLLLIQEDA